MVKYLTTWSLYIKQQAAIHSAEETTLKPSLPLRAGRLFRFHRRRKTRRKVCVKVPSSGRSDCSTADWNEHSPRWSAVLGPPNLEGEVRTADIPAFLVSFLFKLPRRAAVRPCSSSFMRIWLSKRLTQRNKVPLNTGEEERRVTSHSDGISNDRTTGICATTSNKLTLARQQNATPVKLWKYVYNIDLTIHYFWLLSKKKKNVFKRNLTLKRCF